MNLKRILSLALLPCAAFVAFAQHPTPVHSYLEIYDLESGTHKVIKEFDYVVEAPDWTPDGQWLVFNSGGKLYKMAPDGSTDPIEIPTGSITQCNNDHVVTVDNKWIGLSSNDPSVSRGGSYVFIMPFEGGEPRKITPLSTSYLHGISPDGKTIAYFAQRGTGEERSQDVYTMSIKGGKEIRMTDAPGVDDGPEYSRDGKYIWFNSERTGRMQAWRMRANGKDQTQMTFDEDMNSWFPHISPDGQKVVYIAYHDYELQPSQHLPDLNVQIRMIPATGGEPKVLVEFFGGQGSINVNSWSPDSKKFAYISYRTTEELTAPKKEMAVQLYSVRSLIGTPELFAKNHDYVLRRLSELGYTGVEAISYADGMFSGLTPAAFRSEVEKYGLKIVSSHASRGLLKSELASGDFSAAMRWWDDCIAAHKAAGIPRIVLTSLPLPEDEAQLKAMASFLEAVGAKCREAGIRFGYHSHSHEYNVIAGNTVLDYFISHTSPENVFFQMDVYWAVIGKASPVEYFTKYPGRFELLHIKDKYEIGQSGMVGFEAIFKNAARAGMKGYVVEMEYASTPNILRGLRESALYLRNASYVLPDYSNLPAEQMRRR